MHLLLGYHCEVLQYSLKTGLFFCILKSTQSSIEILFLTNFLFALVAQKFFFMSKMYKWSELRKKKKNIKIKNECMFNFTRIHVA